MNNFRSVFSHQNLEFKEDMYDVVEDADALILCTEWNQFRSPDFKKAKSLMKNPIIFDGRNLYNKTELENMGFELHQI